MSECKAVESSVRADDDNKIDCARLGNSTTMANFNLFFSSFTNRVSKLHLNNKTNDEIYRLCKDLVKNTLCLNKGLLIEDSDADPVQVIDSTTHFIVGKLEEYSSAYKRTKEYKSDAAFVPPKELSLGVKWERLRDKKSKVSVPKLTPCKFQFISIVDTLKSLFKREDFREAYISYNFEQQNRDYHSCESGIYRDFCCGKVFAKNEFFQLNPSAIRIHIANDDFETGNALGSKATVHKLSAFYFTIENMPSIYRSKLENIYLLCLCYADDLKTEYVDINDIWHLVQRDINYLETHGIDIGDGRIMKGTLTNSSFDNLGANQAFGFVASFNSTYFCRICEMSKSECKSSSCEDPSKIRKIDTYNKTIESIMNSTNVDVKETRGIKMKCVLNDLKYFHILKNWSVDIMHDLNEGVIPFVLKGFFSKMIEIGLHSIESLNDWIQSFDYGSLNQRNLPSKISLEKSNLNQNATQSKCLLQHISFVFWKHWDNEYLKYFWTCIQSLLRIVVICYSTEITQKNIDFLHKEIETHLDILKELQFQLIPKHHFLTHYPKVIEEMGSLVNMSTHRFERKHKQLKSFMKNNSNFTNITQTIARKHQEYLSVIEDSYKIKKEAGIPKLLPNIFIETHLELFREQNVLTQDLMAVKFMKFCNQYYAENLFIFNLGKFNEICKILQLKDNYYFLCIQYEVLRFDRFHNSFEIKKSDQLNYILINFDTLEHKSVYEKKSLNQSFYIICDTLILGNQFNIFESKD